MYNKISSFYSSKAPFDIIVNGYEVKEPKHVPICFIREEAEWEKRVSFGITDLRFIDEHALL